MGSKNKNKYVMTADFGEEAGVYNWETIGDLNLWIKQLLSDWSWISSEGNNPANLAWSHISNSLNQVQNSLNQALNYTSVGQEGNYELYLSSAKTDLVNLITLYPWLLESGRKAFLMDLKHNRKSYEASIIVAYWMNKDLSGAALDKTIAALMACEFFELGIRDRVKNESSALKKLVGSIQNLIAKYSDQEITQKENFENFINTAELRSVENQAAFDLSQTTRNESFDNLISDARAELNQLKDTYYKHMAIAAPVEYWEKNVGSMLGGLLAQRYLLL